MQKFYASHHAIVSLTRLEFGRHEEQFPLEKVLMRGVRVDITVSAIHRGLGTNFKKGVKFDVLYHKSGHLYSVCATYGL